MRIVIMTAITAVALPFMAFGQTKEEPQQTQEQTNETQTTAPAKGKKMHPAQEQSKKAKPETGTDVRGQTNVKGRAPNVNRNQPGARSSTSQRGMAQDWHALRSAQPKTACTACSTLEEFPP